MRVILKALLPTVFVACTGGETTTPTEFAVFSASNDVDRVVSSVAFDTLWMLGGSTDTLLAAPTLPRALGDGGLVFLDLFDQRVHRVGPDGRILWSWGRKGEGPGELQDVQGVDLDHAGNVVLVDARRLVRITLSPEGDFIGEETVARRNGFIRSVALLGDGTMAVQTSRVPWGVWEQESIQPVSGLPAGWSEMPSLQNQGRMDSWREDGWVFGLAYGNGWLVFRGTSMIGVHPYVEHHDFPGVITERRGFSRISRMTERPPSSGRSVSVRADTLYVLFGGTSPRRGYMLDVYDLTTGRYLVTHMLPHYANRAVVDEAGRVFTIDNSSTFPAIVGLAPRLNLMEEE